MYPRLTFGLIFGSAQLNISCLPDSQTPFGRWIHTEGTVATTDVIKRDGRWPGVIRGKRVADISAFGHDVMNMCPVGHRNEWVFDISRVQRQI